MFHNNRRNNPSERKRKANEKITETSSNKRFHTNTNRNDVKDRRIATDSSRNRTSVSSRDRNSSGDKGRTTVSDRGLKQDNRYYQSHPMPLSQKRKASAFNANTPNDANTSKNSNNRFKRQKTGETNSTRCVRSTTILKKLDKTWGEFITSSKQVTPESVVELLQEINTIIKKVGNDSSDGTIPDREVFNMYAFTFLLIKKHFTGKRTENPIITEAVVSLINQLDESFQHIKIDKYVNHFLDNLKHIIDGVEYVKVLYPKCFNLNTTKHKIIELAQAYIEEMTVEISKKNVIFEEMQKNNSMEFCLQFYNKEMKSITTLLAISLAKLTNISYSWNISNTEPEQYARLRLCIIQLINLIVNNPRTSRGFRSVIYAVFRLSKNNLLPLFQLNGMSEEEHKKYQELAIQVFNISINDSEADIRDLSEDLYNLGKILMHHSDDVKSSESNNRLREAFKKALSDTIKKVLMFVKVQRKNRNRCPHPEIFEKALSGLGIASQILPSSENNTDRIDAMVFLLSQLSKTQCKPNQIVDALDGFCAFIHPNHFNEEMLDAYIDDIHNSLLRILDMLPTLNNYFRIAKSLKNIGRLAHAGMIQPLNGHQEEKIRRLFECLDKTHRYKPEKRCDQIYLLTGLAQFARSQIGAKLHIKDKEKLFQFFISNLKKISLKNIKLKDYYNLFIAINYMSEAYHYGEMLQKHNKLIKDLMEHVTKVDKKSRNTSKKIEVLNQMFHAFRQTIYQNQVTPNHISTLLHLIDFDSNYERVHLFNLKQIVDSLLLEPCELDQQLKNSCEEKITQLIEKISGMPLSTGQVLDVFSYIYALYNKKIACIPNDQALVSLASEYTNKLTIRRGISRETQCAKAMMLNLYLLDHTLGKRTLMTSNDMAENINSLINVCLKEKLNEKEIFYCLYLLLINYGNEVIFKEMQQSLLQLFTLYSRKVSNTRELNQLLVIIRDLPVEDKQTFPVELKLAIDEIRDHYSDMPKRELGLLTEKDVLEKMDMDVVETLKYEIPDKKEKETKVTEEKEKEKEGTSSVDDLMCIDDIEENPSIEKTKYRYHQLPPSNDFKMFKISTTQTEASGDFLLHCQEVGYTYANPKLQDIETVNLLIAPVAILNGGFGVYTDQDIIVPPGDKKLLARYYGREKKRLLKSDDSCYVFQAGNIFIDSRYEGNWTRNLNDSVTPNLEAKEEFNEETQSWEIAIYAIKSIYKYEYNSIVLSDTEPTHVESGTIVIQRKDGYLTAYWLQNDEINCHSLKENEVPDIVLELLNQIGEISNDETLIEIIRSIFDMPKREQLTLNYQYSFFLPGERLYANSNNNWDTDQHIYQKNKQYYSSVVFKLTDASFVTAFSLPTHTIIATHLFVAAMNRNVETVAEILQGCSNPNLPAFSVDIDLNNDWRILPPDKKPAYITPLMIACYFGFEDIVLLFLQHKNIDVDRRTLCTCERAFSFLLKGIASEQVKLNIADALIKHGTDLTLCDSDNRDYLSICIEKNNLLMADYILKQNTDVTDILIARLLNRYVGDNDLISCALEKHEMYILLVKHINDPEKIYSYINDNRAALNRAILTEPTDRLVQAIDVFIESAHFHTNITHMWQLRVFVKKRLQATSWQASRLL